VLATNTIRIIDASKKNIDGRFEVNNNERELVFIPVAAWKPGENTLEAEARLEDLAGNNLNRLFDADLIQKQHDPKEVYKRSFEIR
jgi:hypothetical protein